jgi:hypothetical protein
MKGNIISAIKQELFDAQEAAAPCGTSTVLSQEYLSKVAGAGPISVEPGFYEFYLNDGKGGTGFLEFYK